MASFVNCATASANILKRNVGMNRNDIKHNLQCLKYHTYLDKSKQTEHPHICAGVL